MSPRVPLLLNLIILVVNFVLLCAHSESEGRALGVMTRAAATPDPWRHLRRPPPEEPRANRATPGAIDSIPHMRLLRFLAHVDGAAEFTGRQRRAVYDALDHCCAAMARASREIRTSDGDPRGARARIEREVEARLRAAEFRDDSLARMVRVVVASAG